MKRTFFYLIVTACILGSTFVALLMGEFLPKGALGFKNGFEVLKTFFKLVIDGNYNFKADAVHFFTLGLLVFAIFNAGILLAMFTMMLLCKFQLYRIKKFYTIALWFLFSAIILTGTWMWLYIEKNPGKFDINNVLWFPFIPQAAGLAVCVLGLVLSFFDRRR